MRVFIGLDVSLAKTAICVVDRDGAVQWQGKVPSEPGPLIKRLAEFSASSSLRGSRPVLCRSGSIKGFVRRAYRSSVSRRDTLSASCRLAPSRPTRTMPAASPR
jgi:hypothetical protein